MPSLKQFNLILLSLIIAECHIAAVGLDSCNYRHKASLTFHLVKSCARSQQKVIEYANSESLEDCIELTKRAQGMAFNYASMLQRSSSVNTTTTNLKYITPNITNKRNRKHFFEELHEYFDCIVLECPENATFAGLVKDKRFNYYSLYDTQLTTLNYTCVPEVGLFYLVTQPAAFWNASLKCANISEYTGSLAYVTSEKRSEGFAQMLNNYNLWKPDAESSIFQALVNLYYNSTYQRTHKSQGFKTTFNESINCFTYSAWEAGYPKFNNKLMNTSCVAITTNGTWTNTDCNAKYPFICEIYTLNMTRNAFFYSFDHDFC